MQALATKRNMRSLIAAFRLWISPRVRVYEIDPVTLAIHARLDASTERLDRVLHTLTRRLSSKLDRSHLAIVPKGNEK